MKEKVVIYIDGLNLYNGLKESNLKKYYWLNLESLGKKLIKPDQTIVKIKYFTSMIYRDNNLDSFGLNKYQRQNKYIKGITYFI